ncbi:MAG: VCBS repeat-containing protein, partial [Deltaproteobacteria bacterium]|nr:VCBS repeat-containing protein [Deltaproteobacteria bacterium]
HGLAVADVNGDGLADLIVSTRSSGELYVFLGDGKGGFTPLPVIQTGQDIIALAAADFDSDRKTDLALVSASYNSVILLLGDGKGGFSPFVGSGSVKM